MVLLKLIGIILFFLSGLSGIAIYINTLLNKIKDDEAKSNLWVFFFFCLIGGAALYGLGNQSLKGIIYVYASYGVILIILSGLSGITIYVNTFTNKIKDVKAKNNLSGLFISCLIGGALFYSLGRHSLDGFVYISYILLSLGGISAITSFLMVIQIFDVKDGFTLGTVSVICTLIGAAGVIILNYIIKT